MKGGPGCNTSTPGYYDPKLGLFLQPDWFEVTAAGVGTNRYAYAGGDPVNASDPGGNLAWFLPAFACAGGGCEAALAGLGIALGLWGTADVALDGQLNGQFGPADNGSQVVFNSAQQSLNLPEGIITPGGAKHILDGDFVGGIHQGGGHRAGTGIPGYTEFPETWPDQKIIDAIEDVYWNGEEVDDLPNFADDTGIIGQHDGVRIHIIVKPDGEVRAAYPEAGQEEKGVQENPPR